jgi:hypothetical protein
MRYKYKVCKGQKVLALSTTLREAEDEAKRVGGRVVPVGRKKNPLLIKPNVDLSKHRLHRAGDTYTRRIQAWLGKPNADLYEGVHVSPCPSAATTYALNRLKVDADAFEVTDAPVLIGLSAACKQPDLGDMDVLTLAHTMHDELLDKFDVDEAESEDADLEWLQDYAATESYDEYLGLVFACGDWANRPSVYDLNDALIQLARSPSKERAIELAKEIVPQQRWGKNVPDSCVVSVVVLPPYKPDEDTASRESFPYDTSANEEFANEPIDRDYLDSFIRRGWKVLWGDPSKAAFWHGTSASLAAKAFPALVNRHAANELCFDPAPYREDLEENPRKKNPERTWIPPAEVAAEARQALALRAKQPESNKCCTPVGIARAKQLANRQPVSETTLRRMKAYFDRHAVDAKGKGWGVDSKGWQAWLAWGGDSGRAWCQKILRGL